ncbi:hypothetical protein GCM10011374_39760 [Kocuria dechangensis]|uniref:STAS domain-containing protein n=1 Tax=Kocuria dechangensis TaxID=1176249 RepID=A0A917H8K9_9MICC|nr:hypothetical protein [Kocuria dechangensis]GGG71143.1 hypothetical protein GCM10011374_39760 [Kocuria dechangensis]
MDHKLSVLVQVDLHGTYVRLVVTGCVTETNQHALHPLIVRAQTLIPSGMVTVDLTCAEHVEAAAVEQLRAAVDHDQTLSRCGLVEVLSPARLPAHRPVTALPPQARHRLGSALRLSA